MAGTENETDVLISATSPVKRQKIVYSEDISTTASPPTPSTSSHTSDETVEAEREMAEFLRMRKNKVACLSHLVRLAQRIERAWESEVLRFALLGTFREALLSLEGHKNKECADLAIYGEKMKNLDMDLKHFLVMALPIERQHTRGLRDEEFLVLRPDDLASAPQSPQVQSDQSLGLPRSLDLPQERQRLPLVFVLDNLRSAFNVGAIFRTAECLRVRKIFLCGYTATPQDNKGQTGRAAMGAEHYVPWEHRPKALQVLQDLRAEGMHVVALETVKDAVSVHRHDFPAKPGVAVVLGNERHGLEADILAECSAVVRIPCHGVKNSLNVGIAASICGYEVSRQWSWGEGPETI